MGQDAGSVVCDPGMTTGINQFGAPDDSNTETCYPTLDAATIVSCNNDDTRAAEMRIRISSEFFSSFGASGYQQDTDGSYFKTIPLTRDNMRLSLDGGGKFSSY